MNAPLIEVRDSRLHGLGVFAARRIPSGTRVIEYLGERVSHTEADRRYDIEDAGDNHTFLFIVDLHTVIDAGVDGNEARFMNHSCEPNCESLLENQRVYIDAIFACRCGFEHCRGSMLWPAPRAPQPRAEGRRSRRR